MLNTAGGLNHVNNALNALLSAVDSGVLESFINAARVIFFGRDWAVGSYCHTKAAREPNSR